MHMRKYFFAYYEWNGMIFPVSWVEEDGACIGGHQREIEGSKVEINEAAFVGPLAVLMELYPFQGVA